MFNTLESEYILNITKEIVEKGIVSNCYKERNVINSQVRYIIVA